MGDATRILGDIGDMTRGVFTSVGLTAAIQAALIGLALLVLGAPRPLPLAALSFFLAILPGGVALVWAPVALWLAAQGHTWSAAAMAVCNIGGSLVGTRLALRGGSGFVRKVFIVVVSLLILRTAWTAIRAG